jgi:hypothetical protein
VSAVWNARASTGPMLDEFPGEAERARVQTFAFLLGNKPGHRPGPLDPIRFGHRRLELLVGECLDRRPGLQRPATPALDGDVAVAELAPDHGYDAPAAACSHGSGEGARTPGPTGPPSARAAAAPA